MKCSQGHLCGNFSYKTPAETLKHNEKNNEGQHHSEYVVTCCLSTICQLVECVAQPSTYLCVAQPSTYLLGSCSCTLGSLLPLERNACLPPGTSSYFMRFRALKEHAFSASNLWGLHSYRSPVRASSLRSKFAYSLLSDGVV